EGDGYRVEKIVFESELGFMVTAALFLPEGVRGRGPAILHLNGHTQISFRGEAYQPLILNLARKGFVVLAIDPSGQGERLEYVDSAGASEMGAVGSTPAHAY